MSKHSIATVFASIGVLILHGCKSSAQDDYVKMCNDAQKHYEAVDTNGTTADIFEKCKNVESDFDKSLEKFLQRHSKKEREHVDEKITDKAIKGMEKAKQTCFEASKGPEQQKWIKLCNKAEQSFDAVEKRVSCKNSPLDIITNCEKVLRRLSDECDVWRKKFFPIRLDQGAQHVSLLQRASMIEEINNNEAYARAWQAGKRCFAAGTTASDLSR